MYQIMPELWLHKVFPAVFFGNTNLPDNRYRVCVSEKKNQTTSLVFYRYL